MSAQDSEARIRRLFIGNISKALAENPQDIQNRISKFGSVKSDIELHQNEVRGLSFGYLDIELSDKDYTRLKNALNGVNYMGSKLVIDVAKENFESRWEKDHNRPEDLVKAKMIKKQYKFWKKLENIQKTFKDTQEVIPGRMRTQRKKDIKKMTFRVSFNGEKKIVRCHKTKLWGYEKNKPLRDLVYRFTHNVWKDGNDHIVERFTKPLRITQNGQTLTIEKVDEAQLARDEEFLQDLGDDEDEDEKEKNNKVLASLLGSFDFDKPLELKEDDEEFGHSDYEYEGNYKDNDDSDEDTYKKNSIGEIEYVKEGEFAKQKTVNFDDDDEDEDDRMDVDQSEEEQQQPEEQPEEEEEEELVEELEEKEQELEEEEQEQEEQEESPDEDEDEDHEFIPTFGASHPGETNESTQTQVPEGTISNTETLRSLFNTEDQGTFKLIEESDDDIDQTKKTVVDDVIIPESNITSIIAPKLKNKKGLFFPHFDSPFLVAQTQLNKLNTNVNLEQWEDQFWDKRSEWTKEFKRRKRDVLRQLRKKNARNARVVL